MVFLEIIKKRKIVLISIFLTIYVMLNLLDGKRGLISYYEKINVIEILEDEKKLLTLNLIMVEKNNRLLSKPIDIDYLETLYRKKFMISKVNEKIYYK